MTAGSVVTSSAAVLSTGPSFGQGVPGNSQYGVKALLFDMFGTVLDWRAGVARSVEATLKPRGYDLDWFAFADAWRAQYDPGMEEVRSGRIPYTRLDVLHRRMLDLFLPRFGVKDLSEDVMHDLTLSPGIALTVGQTSRPHCRVWARSFYWHPALMAISC